MKQLYRKVYWWLYMVCLSVPWMWRYCLRDEVIYDRRVWVLAQGVRKPVWTLSIYLTNGQVMNQEVHEKDFRKVWTPANVLRSFRNGYEFYHGYWYDIWVFYNERRGAP